MAAKASASAFNSFFYQQQQEHQKQHQQNSNVINNTNSSSNKMDANGVSMTSEPVHDLHLKMSKKIAQLTKVSPSFYFVFSKIKILK